MREEGAAPSLAALARRIGCSAPALYAHFTNKDDLLETVRSRVLADMREHKEERYTEPSGDPLDLLERGGRAYVEFARQNPALYRLIYAPEHDALRNTAIVMDSEMIAPLANGVRAAQKAGYFHGVTAENMALLLWFSLHGAVLIALDHQIGETEDDAWRQAHRVIDTLMQLVQAVDEK